MKYLSVCSGIEAASVAWHGLGWEPVGFSEIEKFPSQVLATRFPGVKNYGDMTRFKEWDIERGAIDVLVGGTPCQAFSVAGLRKGLSDPRGNLALTFVAMVDHYRPEWVVWENVPGVLSSSGGRDFGAFLGALGELGYGWSYRVLDAQYFGVAQRRRRVFVVAHASGDARRAAEVLFEPSCLRGDPPPRRETWQGFAGDASARVGKHGQDDASGTMKWPVEVAPTLNTLYGTKMGLEDQHAFGGAGLFVPVISASNSQEHAAITVDFASTLTALHEQPYIAVPQTLDQDVCGTITAGFGKLGAPEVDAYTAIPVAMTPEQATDRQTFTASIGDFKEDEVAKTILRNTGAGGETQNPAWVIEPVVYESHPNDSRVTGPVEQCPTVAARWGTGGNNTPLVQQAIGFDPTGSTADPMNEMIPAIRGVSGGNAGHHVGVAVQQPMAFTHSGYSNQPAWITGDRTDCLSAGGHSDTSHQGIGIIESVQQPMAMHTVSESGDVSSTLRTGWNADVFNIVSVQQPMAMRESGQGYWMQDEVIGTIRAEGENRPSRPSNVVAVQQPIAMINMQGSKGNAVAQVSDQSFTLNAMHGHDVHAVAVQQAMASDPVQVQWASGGGQVENPTAQALRSGAEHNYQFVRHEMAVRRLTPVECERLQGFPDGWTDIQPGGKDTPDSPRYKALGNSMAVPVMRWIGERIEAHK